VKEEFTEIEIRIEGDDRCHVIQVPNSLSSAARSLYLRREASALIHRRHGHNFQGRVEFRGDELQDVWHLAKAHIRPSKAASVIAPPAFAQIVISFLAPKNTVQALLGDLQEMFQKNADRFSDKQARRMYWMQVVPLIWQGAKRLGFLAVLVDYFRSKFGL
jgi:hypothetical protein